MEEKSLVIVDVYYFKNNERWHGARFKSPKHDTPLQVYGPTARELQENLYRELNWEFGLGQYTIHETDNCLK